MFTVNKVTNTIYISYQLNPELRNKVFITACNQLILSNYKDPLSFYSEMHAAPEYPALIKALNNRSLK